MPLPDGTDLGSVTLSVADLDRPVGFYADVIGLAVHRRTDDRAVLGAGGRDLLTLRAAPDVPPRPADAAGLFHVAYLVPDRAALADGLGRLRSSWERSGASDHDVSEALYCRDPEDNGVELSRDRPRKRWERTPDGDLRIGTKPLDLDALAAEATGEQAAPPGTRVGHVHLEVTDLDRAREFYVDALGFEVAARNRGVLFVAAGGYHHHLGLNVWNGRTEPATGRGLDHFEVALPDSDALAAAVDRLRDGGFAVRETDGGTTAEDPDGIGVRLVVDR
jgi:catechol 2,3-dioxygenase